MDVSPDLEVENFKALCEVECDVPSAECFISSKGVPLSDEKKTLSAYGVKEDDMLLLERRDTSSTLRGTQQQMTGTTVPGQLPSIDFGSIRVPGGSREGATGGASLPVNQAEPDPAALRQILLSNLHQMSRLKETNPPLANAANHSLEKFTEVLQQQRKMRADQEMHRIRMLSADPLDASAQGLIAEEIRQRNVNDNMETAIEHMPENFGQVIMLYIDCVVNGHPVKAFVDSGAQMTIMSQACAERCNIMRLVDRRWEGIAKGVGTQKIIGRVHLGQISIGGTFFPTSFTILENQPMDMLLGLDMLKRHQCCIDLKDNKLKIGTSGTETPFLPESELPACARQSNQEVPKSEDQQLAEALAQSAEEMETDQASNANQSNSLQPAANQSNSQQPTANPNVRESDIKKITDMGYSRQDAIRELDQADGDFNVACVKLLAKSLKTPGQQ